MARDLDPPPFDERADAILAGLPPPPRRSRFRAVSGKLNAFVAGFCVAGLLFAGFDWVMLVLAVGNALCALDSEA